MTLRGGVIIIGSLLWDTEKNRPKWREKHLSCKDKFQVALPIRYGRRSDSRENTYTMVFSNKCYSKRYGLGKGWILPIASEIKPFNDLKREAVEMGRAEGFENGLFSKWGSVALSFNPNKKIDLAIKEKWRVLLSCNKNKAELLNAHLKGEKSVIDSNGFLAIRWPKEVIVESKLEGMDFLISTITKPTLINGKYPTVNQITDAMEESKYYNYFLKNRKHKITTFQDEKILRRIPKEELEE